MAVLTVFQASDGTIFIDRNKALAYDATLLRRESIMAHFRTHRPLLTDTGRMREMVDVKDIVDCLVADAALFRSTILV